MFPEMALNFYQESRVEKAELHFTTLKEFLKYSLNIIFLH